MPLDGLRERDPLSLAGLAVALAPLASPFWLFAHAAVAETTCGADPVAYDDARAGDYRVAVVDRGEPTLDATEARALPLLAGLVLLWARWRGDS
jgi:hypothetical protein